MSETPKGLDTLITVKKRLLALHHQVMNLNPAEQEIGTYGIMVPRWAAAPGTKSEDVRELYMKVARRRAVQDVRLVDAIKVVDEIIKEHSMSTDFTEQDLTGRSQT